MLLSNARTVKELMYIDEYRTCKEQTVGQGKKTKSNKKNSNKKKKKNSNKKNANGNKKKSQKDNEKKSTNTVGKVKERKVFSFTMKQVILGASGTIIAPLVVAFLWNLYSKGQEEQKSACNNFKSKIISVRKSISRIEEQTPYNKNDVLSLASDLEEMFYSGKTKKSLFSKCDALKEMKFLHSGGYPEPGNLMNFDGMVSSSFGSSGFNYNPILGKRGLVNTKKFEWHDFEFWWKESVIFLDAKSKETYTRKDLVLNLVYNSGDSNVTNFLPKDVKKLKNMMGWNYFSGNMKKEISRKSDLASLHNIGIEVIRSYAEFNKL